MIVYTATQIKAHEVASAKADGYYKPARPISFFGISTVVKRVKAAFLVLIGRYDALDWEGH